MSETKANTNWLANSINCCFPARLPDRPGYEKYGNERELDIRAETQEKAIAARREPAMPLSKYNTTKTVTSQPQQIAPPTVPSNATHIVREHPRYSRESSRKPVDRSSQQDETTWTWYGEEPEAVARRMSKRSRKSTEQKRSMSRKRSASRRQAQQERFSCASPIPQIPAFHPLHLSIHLPGNELPTLPQFSDDLTTSLDAIPPVPQVPRPAQAILRAKPLIRDTSFKTVAAIPYHKTSSDTLRRSTDTDLTMCEPTPITRPAMNYSRLRSPSAGSARSNQDFLEMLNNPLPALPIQYNASPIIITSSATSTPPPALLHPDKKKSNRDLRKEAAATSPVIPTLVRSASDQNKRLQAHLLEREEVNIASPACSTIAEEKTPTITRGTSLASRRRSSSCPAHTPRRNMSIKGLGIDTTPMPTVPATTEEEKEINMEKVAEEQPMSATITDFTSLDPLAFPSPLVFPSPLQPSSKQQQQNTSTTSPTSPPHQRHHQQRSSSGSSTLLNTISPSLRDTPEPGNTPIIFDRPKTEVITTITAVQPKPISIHVSARLSQWLRRSRGMSLHEKRESMLSLLKSEGRESVSSNNGVSWFAEDKYAGRGMVFQDGDDGDDEQRDVFRVSAVAKEIGLGELLDQRLGIRHSIADDREEGSLAALSRRRSGTDSAFVGTEKGSVDLVRKFTTEEGRTIAMPPPVAVVGVAM